MRRPERETPPADADDLFTAAPLPQAPLDDRQRLACLRLIRTDGIGPVAFRELINRFGGAQEALDALPAIARQAGRLKGIALFPTAAAEAELAAAARAGARPLFTIEPGYPAMLARIEQPPPVIYVRGRPDLLAGPGVAIVGSRECSAGGISIATTFAAALGHAGYVVISGFARGIDTAAHRAALATGTVTVLAGGIDQIYPPENADLYERIADTGCLLTTQPPGIVPKARDFPRRNRIIAGLSLGVLVVEAARRSGTLITARFAGELGREVMAIPGHPLDPRAEGTNQLLKDGATLVTTADEVIELLVRQHGGRPARPPKEPGSLFRAATTAEASLVAGPPVRRAGSVGAAGDRLLAILGPSPVGVDQLARAAGLPISEVHGALLELSLAGLVELHGAHMVSRPVRGNAPE